MIRDFGKSLLAVGAVLGMSACGTDDLVQLFAPDLHAHASSSSVHLMWDAQDAATAYDIWRGSDASSLGLLEADYQGVEYNDGGVNAGSVFYYAVTAKDDEEQEATSATVGAFPHTPPVGDRVYENTSTQGSYFQFNMIGGFATGMDLTQVQVDAGERADFGLNTHEGGQPLDPEIRSPHFTTNQTGSLFAEVMTGATYSDFDVMGFHQDDEGAYQWVDELAAAQYGLYLVKNSEGNFAKIFVTSGDASSPLLETGADDWMEFEWDYNPNGIILF